MKSRIGGYKAGLFTTSISPDRQFRGRKDPYRHWLELGLLALWIDLFEGDLSFSRKLDGTPYGPLVEFLTLTLHAITGSAPGPAGIAKIIDQYRKQRPYFPY